MKIGIYCTNNIVYPVPPNTIYANMSVAGELADTLSDSGEDVTFFAPMGTKTKAKLVSFDMPPFDDTRGFSSYDYEDLMVDRMLNYIETNDFDILNSHCRPLSIVRFAALKPNLPVLVTVHDPLHYPGYNLLPKFNEFKNLHFASLTNAQRKTRPELRWEYTIYNGVDPNLWTYQPESQGYLLFIGRIMKEKGVDLAIQIAQKTNLPLKIVGSIYDDDKAFFAEKIAPFLNSSIEYLGLLPREQLPKLYGGAIALLAPVRWEEPFGLVFIEANSCGTPVIATRRGSVPEIIVDGENGFIVDDENDIEGFVNAINRVKAGFPRPSCRTHVENNFTLKKMAENYLEAYRQICRGGVSPPVCV